MTGCTIVKDGIVERNEFLCEMQWGPFVSIYWYIDSQYELQKATYNSIEETDQSITV